MSVDFNFIDILIKNYWIENSSFYIMSEGIIGKSQISDPPTSSVTSMIQNLGWEELQHRREQCKTIMMYRIVNDLIDIPAENYLIHSGTTTRGHGTRFLVPYCSVNAYKSSFFPSTIRLWNSLPVSAVTAPSLDAFKGCVGAGPAL